MIFKKLFKLQKKIELFKKYHILSLPRNCTGRYVEQFRQFLAIFLSFSKKFGKK